MGDSLYEYMLKKYLLDGDSLFLKMYKESMVGMKSTLFRAADPSRQPNSGFAYIGDLEGGLVAKMDHLVSSIHHQPFQHQAASRVEHL